MMFMSLQSLSSGRDRVVGGRPQLDIDGLSVFADPVQTRMAAMEADYNRRVHYLEKQLSLATAALFHYASTGQGLDPEQLVSNELDQFGLNIFIDIQTSKARSGHQLDDENGIDQFTLCSSYVNTTSKLTVMCFTRFLN